MKCHDAEEANLIISDIVPMLPKEYRIFRTSLGNEDSPLRKML